MKGSIGVMDDEAGVHEVQALNHPAGSSKGGRASDWFIGKQKGEPAEDADPNSHSIRRPLLHAEPIHSSFLNKVEVPSTHNQLSAKR